MRAARRVRRRRLRRRKVWRCRAFNARTTNPDYALINPGASRSQGDGRAGDLGSENFTKSVPTAQLDEFIGLLLKRRSPRIFRAGNFTRRSSSCTFSPNRTGMARSALPSDAALRARDCLAEQIQSPFPRTDSTQKSRKIPIPC